MSEWYYAGGGQYKHKTLPVFSYKDSAGNVHYVHSETDKEIISPWDFESSPLEARTIGGTGSTLEARVTALETENAAQQVSIDSHQVAIDSAIGIPVPWPVNTAPPADYILAHGQDLSQTTFAKLFAVYGTAFGSSGAGQFFNIDLRGVFIRGLDAGAGIDPARVLASIQQDAFQGHRHGIVEEFFAVGVGGVALLRDINAGPPPGSGRSYDPITDGINGAPRTASETRPVNIALDFIVRYQ